MRVVILRDQQQVSERAADLICQTVTANPRSVLGLATGGTPLGTYDELVARYGAGQVSFQQCTSFNLDEYVGLDRDHDQSYRTFMHQHLFSKTDFDPDRCHLPDGQADDFARACETYEKLIREAGGIDLQLLGIGSDGHIAFNEPGSSLASRTRIKALTAQTRQDNARFFAAMEDVPKLAITMGIGTILEAESVLLLATGSHKAEVVKSFVEGPVTAQVPASALQMHPRVTVVLDEEAAGRLVRREYYRYVESIQAELDSHESLRQHSSL